MSTRHLTLGWITSSAAFGLFCAFVIYVSIQTPLVGLSTKLGDVEVVVIGSSMTHATLPASGSLFDDGRTYTKNSIDSMSKGQSLAMLNHVVDHGVPTVIVEANDKLVIDEAHLNDKGRARFVREFKTWVQSEP